MKLETNDETIESPSPDDIEAIVASLGGTQNDFAILQKNEWTYLQTANQKNLGYILEYQEGSLQRHYQTASNLTADQVKQAFIWYLQGDKRWLSAFIWTRIELGGETEANSQREENAEKSPSEAELTIIEALQIFGLKQGATKEQLQRQYRAMITKCHPDRVNHLDSEFQKLAEEKTKLLNETYGLLVKMMSMQ
jgi:DnaJ-domain-containing protein 1